MAITRDKTLAEAARAYARFWAIHPLRFNSKHPASPNGFHDARRDAGPWGKTPGYNIGLSCHHERLCAIDFDQYKDDFEGDELLGTLWDRFPTVSQHSGGGGLQLLYKQPDGLQIRSSNDKLLAGVDVKASGGYVVLPPSIHPSGNRYRWVEGRSPEEMEVATLPDVLLDMLEAIGSVLPQDDTEGPGAAQPSQPIVNHSQGDAERVRQALERLPAEWVDDYDDWVRVGLAVKHGLNGDGFELWNDWSAQSAKYPGHDAAWEKWQGLTPTGAVTLGTLFYHAGMTLPDIKLDFSGNGSEPLEYEELELYRYHAEDGGILDAWLDYHGRDWLFVTGYDDWFNWDGRRWRKDEHLAVRLGIQHLMVVMNTLARAMKTHAEQVGDDDGVKMAKSYITATKRTKTRVVSVETMARPHRPARPDDLDRGNVLNLLNGTLDLETLELRHHDPADLMTHILGYEYNPEASAPRWEKFLREVLVHEDDTSKTDEDMVKVFQELVGYTLTQEVNREVMVWLAGSGGNGKSVTISVLSHLLGPMARPVSFQHLGEAGNYSMADLPGKRLIFSTEARRGGRIAEELIREIVTGTEIEARPIFGTPFVFEPVAKIWWAMNDKPVIRDTSNAIWRRLKLIPFNREFSDEEKDVKLTDTLLQELPGVLNWAVEGLQRLRQNDGFTACPAVDAAVAAYKQESNPVAQWLEDCAEIAEPRTTKASEAYEQYREWCKASGYMPLNLSNFGTEIAKIRWVEKESTYKGVLYNIRITRKFYGGVDTSKFGSADG